MREPTYITLSQDVVWFKDGQGIWVQVKHGRNDDLILMTPEAASRLANGLQQALQDMDRTMKAGGRYDL